MKFSPSTAVGKPLNEPEGKRECFFHTKERRKEGALKFSPSTAVGKPLDEPEGKREMYFFHTKERRKEGVLKRLEDFPVVKVGREGWDKVGGREGNWYEI